MSSTLRAVARQPIVSLAAFAEASVARAAKNGGSASKAAAYLDTLAHPARAQGENQTPVRPVDITTRFASRDAARREAGLQALAAAIEAAEVPAGNPHPMTDAHHTHHLPDRT